MSENRKPSAEIRQRLATNVKKLRWARSFTQHDLAARCQFAPSYIGDIEREVVNITLSNLEALAGGLDCLEIDLLMPLNRDPEVSRRRVQAITSEEA